MTVNEEIISNLYDIKNSLCEIQSENEEMFNHFTERYEEMFKQIQKKTIPVWLLFILTMLSSTTVGIIIRLI